MDYVVGKVQHKSEHELRLSECKAVDKGDKLNFDVFSLELQRVLMRNGMFCILRRPSKPS